MKKMHITENLLRNMTTEEKSKVVIMQGVDTIFSVSEMNNRQLISHDSSHLMRFMVGWSCHAIVNGQSSLQAAKEDMVRHLKNDMYRDILNELYGISKLIMKLPCRSDELMEAVQALINELR